MVDHITASRSKAGDIFLYDSTDDFTASFKQGKWINDQEFEFWELDEFFCDITDDVEVTRLIQEARKALAQLPSTSREPKPKTA